MSLFATIDGSFQEVFRVGCDFQERKRVFDPREAYVRGYTWGGMASKSHVRWGW